MNIQLLAQRDVLRSSAIPDALLVIVLTYADDPRLALVNKQFCLANEKAFFQRLIILRANHEFTAFIPRAIKVEFSGKDASGYVLSVRKMIKIAVDIKIYNKRADQDLSHVFAKISLGLSKLNLVVPKLKGQDKIKAETIRNWMNNHTNDLEKISVLNLNNICLYEIPSEVFLLKNLKKLNLRENYLREVPSEIEQLTQLKHLDLASNELDNLPSSITNLKALTDLSIRKNRFKILPNSLFQLTSLQSLDVSVNQLIGLQLEIGNLASLHSFSASENQIRVLPNEITRLTNLRVELDLSANKIRSLPKEIGAFHLLKDLNLSQNRLKNLPDSISELSSLEKIDLSHNKFQNLPRQIEQLPVLHNLEISTNPIQHWAEKFGHLNHVTWSWVPPGKYLREGFDLD
jgi:Leucine-rich repeat (LRR) protein